VAGTKSEPAPPILHLTPLRFSTRLETPTVERSSSSTPLRDAAAMLYTTDQAAESHPNHSVESRLFVTKRSGILHRVLPLSSRSTSPRSRISKSRQHKTQIGPSSRSRSPTTLHKYITSLLGNGQDGDAKHKISQLRSRASSFGSNPSSSMHGSLPSVDFVSSAAFLFSGPSLHSILSASDSTLRVQRHTSDSNDVRPMSREQTDSFSVFDNASILGSQVLEPAVERDIRAMTDVLLDTSTSIEESPFQRRDQSTDANTSSNSYDLEVHDTSIQHSDVPNSILGYSAGVALCIAALLLPYLDHTA
jgi:hypothetical protein